MMKQWIVTASLILILIASGASTLAQECGPIWAQAEAVIDAQCTESILDNSVCYAHRTVTAAWETPQFFQNPGTIVNVAGLQTIETAPFGGNDWGIAWFKIIARTPIPGYNTGQAVIFIAYGDTTLHNADSAVSNVSHSAPGACIAFIKPGSTTFGGSYLRTVPDPRFQQECATPGCQDKDNLLRYVEEGQPLTVLGVRATNRDTILARDSYVTGWITASDRYVDLSACNINTLPAFTDADILNGLRTPTDVPTLTSFTLRNDGSSVNCQDIPTGGVVVHNPTHQQIRFEANGIPVEMASTVFVRADYAGTGVAVYVLQGTASVTKGGTRVTATTGQAIDAINFATPALMTGGGPNTWCRQFSSMVATAFPGVPAERTDFCTLTPQGYPPITYPLPPIID